MAGKLLDFHVRLLGTDAVVRRLGLAASAVKDLRPVWRAIHRGRSGDPLLRKGGGVCFVRILKQQFASRGKRGGTPWTGYQDEPVYRIIKRRYGGGLKNMLRWERGHERLYPSLVSWTHPEHVFVSKRHRVAMGTKVPYAVSHQLGQGRTKWDDIPLPKRPIIALKRKDVMGWVRAIQRHVEATAEGGVRGARRVV